MGRFPVPLTRVHRSPLRDRNELDVARDDFLPDGGADLVVSDARREVLHRVNDDRSDVRADLLGEVRELIFVPSRIDE